jgi:hypothetical protein
VADQLDVRRPFTRADALKVGVSAKALRGPRFRKVLRGVFVDASSPVSSDERTAAALLVAGDDAFASHTSAGRLYRCPLPVLAQEHVSVRRASRRRRREDVVCHVDPDSDVQLVRGLRCASPLDTFGQLASLVGLLDLVVVGDHLVRQQRTTPEKLVAFCGDLRGAGAAPARRTASYVRARVDSPMETRLRPLLAGIPEPRINHTIRDVDGEPVRRYDLSWPEVRVIAEYDGRHHVERIDQWEADLQRREAIDDDDWRIIVIVADGIYRTPGRTVDRVFRLLQRRRLRDLPGRPADAWRPHFPGRDGIGGDTKAG